MKETEILRFILGRLGLPRDLAIQVLSKLDFKYLEGLPPEEAEDIIEDIIIKELFKKMGLKLSRFYKMGNLKSPGDNDYTLINPKLIWDNTKKLYENSDTWPLTKLLARYRGLCALGAKSLAYAESQKELLTTSYPHPRNPEMTLTRYELDPTQVSGYIVDLVINMPDVIPPIM